MVGLGNDRFLFVIIGLISNEAKIITLTRFSPNNCLVDFLDQIKHVRVADDGTFSKSNLRSGSTKPRIVTAG